MKVSSTIFNTSKNPSPEQKKEGAQDRPRSYYTDYPQQPIKTNKATQTKSDTSSKAHNFGASKWRDTFDYRDAFFERSTGIGVGKNKIWFCCYCGKPLHKKEVQVDHIIPPSRFSNKIYKRGELIEDNSLLATLLNNSFNLVASCEACNKKKSNKIQTGKIVQGYGTVACSTAVRWSGNLLSLLLYWVLSMAHKLLTSFISFFKSSSILVKVVVVFVILFILFK